VTPPVNIFEREEFQVEVQKLQSTAAKADTIAHRTQRTITGKMDEDPVFYRRFGRILQESIDAYRAKRITEAEYLKQATDVMNSVLHRTGDQLPAPLYSRDEAKAFYGIVAEVFDRPYGGKVMSADAKANVALKIDDIIRKKLV